MYKLKQAIAHFTTEDKFELIANDEKVATLKSDKGNIEIGVGLIEEIIEIKSYKKGKVKEEIVE